MPVISKRQWRGWRSEALFAGCCTGKSVASVGLAIGDGGRWIADVAIAAANWCGRHGTTYWMAYTHDCAPADLPAVQAALAAKIEAKRAAAAKGPR